MTKIVALVENTKLSKELYAKHGLCLYIETSEHKILFDLGPDDTFAKNAEKLGIDIKAVDTVVISHGHKDHGGGLSTFMKMNSIAKIYIRKTAFEPHYIKLLKIPFSVSLDKSLARSERFIFTDDNHIIDDELLLFSNVKSSEYHSKSNDVLFAKKANSLIIDSFDHEQNLIITSANNRILISGCSHSGIVNIQKEAERIAKNKMSYVIGGFHLFNPPTKKTENNKLIDDIAGALNKNKSIYYTCHCTGVRVYEQMKETLKNKLLYLSTGTKLEL
ncbi:MAG: MBL fold metallo-hydrolase [Clostridia bacterium]|nr:MBL fold metallo-hydrolase [Clostridia bacterium]